MDYVYGRLDLSKKLETENLCFSALKSFMASYNLTFEKAGAKMQYFNPLFIAVSLLALSACTSANLVSEKRENSFIDLKISLDRTTCLGACPSYVVNITGDGSVSYCGFNYVEQKGRRSRQIDPIKVQALYNQILAADFFNLRNEYRAHVTDSPSYTTSVSVDGKTKTVLDYVGRDAGMPESVTHIQDAIDEIAETSIWIGDTHLNPFDSSIPDCEDEFRPGAKAFRKKLKELLNLPSE